MVNGTVVNASVGLKSKCISLNVVLHAWCWYVEYKEKYEVQSKLKLHTL